MFSSSLFVICDILGSVKAVKSSLSEVFSLALLLSFSFRSSFLRSSFYIFCFLFSFSRSLHSPGILSISPLFFLLGLFFPAFILASPYSLSLSSSPFSRDGRVMRRIYWAEWADTAARVRAVWASDRISTCHFHTLRRARGGRALIHPYLFLPLNFVKERKGIFCKRWNARLCVFLGERASSVGASQCLFTSIVYACFIFI